MVNEILLDPDHFVFVVKPSKLPNILEETQSYQLLCARRDVKTPVQMFLSRVYKKNTDLSSPNFSIFAQSRAPFQTYIFVPLKPPSVK